MLGYSYGTTTSRRHRGVEFSGDPARVNGEGENGCGLRTEDGQTVFDGLSESKNSGDGKEGDFAEGEVTLLLV